MMSDNTVIPLNAWKGKLQSNGKGGPKKSMTNLMLFLRNLPEFGQTMRWNELAQRAEWNGRPIEDSDLVDVRLILERHAARQQTSVRSRDVRHHVVDNRAQVIVFG